jgi:type II secretory pathway pseudopilin PulG
MNLEEVSRVKGELVERRTASHSDETGDTLIEVLVAIIVLSLSGLALLLTFSTAIAASAEHRSLATNDTVLRSTAEVAFSLIQQQASPLFTSCATPGDYVSPNNFGAPAGYSAVFTSGDYWVQ